MLYEDGGSAVYEAIERHPDYYLYETEQRLLVQYADAIVAHIPPKAVLIELGCGDCTKTRILLRALAHRDGHVDFVGIDSSAESLSSSAARFKEDPAIHFTALHDHFFDGLAAATRLFPNRERVVMLLGSTLGNMSFKDSCLFVQTVLELAAPRPGGALPHLLFGLDMWKDESHLRRAYDNEITARFELGGLRNTLRHLDPECVFNEADWRYVVDINRARSQVEMYAEAVRPQRVAGIDFEQSERILLEISHKFRDEAIPSLFAGCGALGTFGDGYRIYVLAAHPSEAYNPWRTYAAKDIEDIDRVARKDYLAFINAYDWMNIGGAQLSILDVGCGSGTIPGLLGPSTEASRAFARSIGTYDLLDISANSLRIAAERIPFHVGSKYHTSIQTFEHSEHFAEAAARGYDLVWSIHGITAVAPEHLDASLLSMLRCTKLGGRTVVVISDHDSHYARIDRAYHADRAAQGIVSRPCFLTAEDVVATLERRGIPCSVVTMTTSYVFPTTDVASFRNFNAWCVYDLDFDIERCGPAAASYIASCRDPSHEGYRLHLSSKAITIQRNALSVLRWLAFDSQIPALAGEDYARCATAFEAQSTQRSEITRALVDSGVYAALAAHAAPELRVLSVGCGDGVQDLAMLRAALPGTFAGVVRYTGIDPNSAQRARCQETMAGATIESAALQAAILSPESVAAEARFEVIHLLHVLYYVPDLRETIRWAAERLTPGGRLLVWHAPNEEMNQLARVFWDGQRPEPIPFADDVEAALRAEGLTYARHRVDGFLRLSANPGSAEHEDVLSFLIQADSMRLGNELRRELAATIGHLAGSEGKLAHPVCFFIAERA